MKNPQPQAICEPAQTWAHLTSRCAKLGHEVTHQALHWCILLHFCPLQMAHILLMIVQTSQEFFMKLKHCTILLMVATLLMLTAWGDRWISQFNPLHLLLEYPLTGPAPTLESGILVVLQ